MASGPPEVTRLIRAPQLRYVAGQSPDRKVTWLELFFDLVFAAAVAQVASPLRADYSLEGLGRFALLFIMIWWAWTGHAVFSTRFDTDDGVQRGLTLLQMFGVAVMAANARDALDSRSSAGFAAAYSVLRFVLVFQYFRARQVAGARQLATRYLVGHGTGGRVVAHVRPGSDPCAVLCSGASRSRSTSAHPGWRFVRASLCLLMPRTSPNDSVCSL